MVIEYIDYRKCNCCGTCVLRCPVDVIRINREEKKPVIRYPEECMSCNFCTYQCPRKAIWVGRDRPADNVMAWG